MEKGGPYPSHSVARREMPHRQADIIAALQRAGNGYELSRLSPANVRIDRCQIYRGSQHQGDYGIFYEKASLRIAEGNSMAACPVYAVTNGYLIKGEWIMEVEPATLHWWPWNNTEPNITNAWLQESTLTIGESGDQLRP